MARESLVGQTIPSFTTKYDVSLNAVCWAEDVSFYY